MALAELAVRFRKAGLPDGALNCFRQSDECQGRRDPRYRHWTLWSPWSRHYAGNASLAATIRPVRPAYTEYRTEAYDIKVVNPITRGQTASDYGYGRDWPGALVAAWRLAELCGWPLAQQEAE